MPAAMIKIHLNSSYASSKVAGQFCLLVQPRRSELQQWPNEDARPSFALSTTCCS